VADVLVACAGGRTVTVRLETGLCLGGFTGSEEPVARGDGEFLLPRVAQCIGGVEGAGELLLFGRGGLEAAAAHLGDVGLGVFREDERFPERGLVERGVDGVGLGRRGSAAWLVEGAGDGEVVQARGGVGAVVGDEAGNETQPQQSDGDDHKCEAKDEARGEAHGFLGFRILRESLILSRYTDIQLAR